MAGGTLRFFRLPDIIGDRRRGTVGLITINRAKWYSWIKTRHVPKPAKSGRTSLWRAEDVQVLGMPLVTGNYAASGLRGEVVQS